MDQPAIPATEKLALTVEEAARMLRISRGAAYEAVRTGEIPSIRFGRTIRIPAPELMRLLGAPMDGDFPKARPTLPRTEGPGGS